MSDFDIAAYLRNKLPNAVGGNNKVTQLLSASEEKTAALRDENERSAANIHAFMPTPVKESQSYTPPSAQDVAADKDSLVSRLGLNAESPEGIAANMAASLWDGTTRLAGQVAGIAPTLFTAGDASTLNEEEMAAANRHSQGIATPADLELLSMKIVEPGYHERDTADVRAQKLAAAKARAATDPRVPTVLEAYQRAQTGREVSRNIVESTQSHLVHGGARRELNADLAEGFKDAVATMDHGLAQRTPQDRSAGIGEFYLGVGKLIVNAGASLLKNPQAVTEYIVENAPQLLVGAAGKAGQAVMTASNIGYATDEYNKGIEAYQMAHNGAMPSEDERQKMAAYAVSLALFEQVGDVAGLAFMKPASKLTKVADAAGAKKAALKIMGATAEGFATEATTEGYQRFAEGKIEGKDATALEIYQDAVIGGASGAGLSGGGRTVAEVTKSTPEHAEQRAAELSAKQALGAAVASGDVSAYLDESNAAFAPDKAVQALFGNSRLKDTTPEAKSANLQKALEIVTELDTWANELTAKSKDTSLSAEERKAANIKFGQIQKQYDSAAAVLDKFLSDSKSAVNVDEEVEAIRNSSTTGTPEEAGAAAERVISLSMSAPERLDPKLARELADNEHLSGEQRAYLRSFADARLAENLLMDMGKVSQTIVTGDEYGNLGINDYRTRMATALEANNQEMAQRNLAGLQSFAADHEAKATVARQALRKGMGTQIVRSMDNASWQINTGEALSDRALRRNGGLKIVSGRLVSNIQSEAAALNKAVAELQNAYAIKFSTPKKAKVNDVPQQPQREGQTRRDAKGSGQPAAQAPEAVGSDAGAGSARRVSGAPAVAPVEANGVAPAAAPVAPEAKKPTTEELAVRALEFLNNPPDDYTPAKGKQTLAWAEKKLATETDEDARSALKQVIAKGKKVVEGDESLKELESDGLDVDAIAAQFPMSAALRAMADRTDAALQGKYEGGTPENQIFNTKENIRWLEKALKDGDGRHPDTAALLEGLIEDNKTVLATLEAKQEKESGHAERVPTDTRVAAAPKEQTDLIEGIVADQVRGKNRRQIQVIVERTKAEQEKRKGLLADDKALAAYAQERGQTIEEMRTLLTENYNDNEKRLPLFEKAMAEAPSADTTGIKWGDALVEEKAAMPTTVSEAVSAEENDGVTAATTTDGTLSVMEHKSPEGTAFKDRKNLIADFFTQTSSKLGDATARPLVAVKNFLSSGVDVLQFLKDGYSTDPTIRKNQEKVIQSFRDAAAHWAPVMVKNLVRGKNPQFFFKDMMQFLIVENADGSGKLDLEENVKTAMAYGLYTWIAENAAKDGWNTDEEINLILGRDEDTQVSDTERALLGPIGTRHQVVANALGQRAIQALGLKVTKDAPADLMAKLQSGIGMHMLKVLLDQKVGVRTTYTDGDFQKMRGNAATFKGLPADFRSQFEQMEGKDARKLKLQDLDLSSLTQQDADAVKAAFKRLKQIHGASHYFIEMNRIDGKLHKQAQSILEDSKKTGGILNLLFKADAGLKAPSIGAPVPYTQTKTKNTQQDVPSVLKEVLRKRNKEAYTVKKDMWSLVNAIDEAVFMEIAGAKHTDNMHKVNKESAAAKNKQLKTEIERIKDFVGAMADLTLPIFFEQNAWKQQRVGLSNNLINPQTSKVHRGLLANEAWSTEVDPANQDQLDNFMLRVGEGLGVKTDKKSNATNLPAIEALIQDPVITAAVDVLVDHINGKALSAEQQQTLLDGVKKGGEDMHSLDALMALAHMQDANGEAFTTDLMGEVDGVANGPILSHLLLGAAASVSNLFDILNRGGFYQMGDGHSQYNLWREVAGHLDLYESTSVHMVQAIQKLRRDPKWGNKNATTLDAIYAFVGNLEATDAKSMKKRRDIVKTPITSMIFGSSIMKSIENMKNQFIGSIYDAIEEAAADPNKATGVLDNLNTVLLMGKGPGLDADETIETLMKRELNRAELEAIEEAFKWSIGKAVEVTMKQDFAVFLQQRDTFNKTANTAFQLYNAAATAIRDAFIGELMDSGVLPFREVSDYTADGKAIPGTKHKEPLHDLLPSQERELAKRLGDLKPVMHSMMSKQSNELNAGLSIGKSSRRISQRPTYESEVHFGTPFADNNSMSTMASGYEQIEIEPGAAMLPISTHSADSAVMHLSEDEGFLNIHDAKGTGPGGAQKAAHSLNKSTWNVMLNYSPASEMADALARTVHALSALLSGDNVPAAVRNNVMRVLTELSDKDGVAPYDVIEEAMRAARAMAFHADRIKLDGMSTMSYLDQYAFEGGAYEVSDADRASAASMRSQLRSELTTAEKKDIDTINEEVTGATTVTVKREVSKQKLLEGPTSEQEATATEQTDENDANANDTSVTEVDVLNVPPIQAMQLLEYGLGDTSLSDSIADQMREVLDAMRKDGKGLKDAVMKVLKGVDAAAMVQLLSQRLASLPQGTFGDLGTPSITSDPKLVAFFENNDQVTARRVLEGLYRMLNKEGSNRSDKLNLLLVRLLAKTIDPELPVVYVTPATAPDQVLDKMTKARGWYTANGFAHGVYVLSPDFRHSGLTVETLLHELTHGAVATTIDAELARKYGPIDPKTKVRDVSKANPAYTSDALTLIEELENLREEAIQYANANGIFKDHKPALSNIQEFVAWGMTNLDFQRDVLAKVQMKGTTADNRLVTGMKKFINTVVKLLFRGSQKSEQEIAENGMTLLISNVSGLFNAASKYKTSAEIVLAQSSPGNAAVDGIYQLSTLDLHDGLADPATPLDPAFDAHLRNLLGSIVEKLHGPFGAFKQDMMRSAANSPLDVWVKAVTNGVAPFASKLRVSPLVFSQQEAHAMEQIEATVRAALDANESHTTVAYKQLSQLYDEAYAHVKPNDFADFDASTGTSAQFDFIFKIESTNGPRSDYLARFAALGLGHAGFNSLLQFSTKKDVKRIADGKTFADKLQIVFENILAFFHSKVVDTWIGQKADAKLATLVEHLVDIEARRRYTMARKAVETPWIEPLEQGIRKGTEAIRGKVGDMASSAWVRSNTNAFIRATGALARTVANDRVDQFVKAMQDLRDRNHKGKLGVFGSALSEYSGPLEVFKRLLLVTKNNERVRKAVITQTAKAVLQGFEAGKTLSKASKAAVTAVFLRTGAHVLLDHFDMAGIDKLISDKSELRKAIGTFEGQLQQFGSFRYYFINQANALGHYKATGQMRSGFSMMNAHNIVAMHGTPYAGRVSRENQGTAAKIVETLVALYALEYADDAHLLNASQLLRSEMGRADKGNGVEFVLKLHKRLEQDSQERLFKNNPTLMIHGYTPEIYNPHTDIKVANEQEGKELIFQGYEKGDPVNPDPSDPQRAQRHIYKLQDGGLQPRLTGAISYTGMAAKGSRQHNGFVNVNTVDGLENAQLQASWDNAKQAEIQRLFQTTVREDLSKVKKTYAAPILNEQGKVVNYRYLMSEGMKDTLLERDNRFEKVMGALAGSVFDKEASAKQNERVVIALMEQYSDEYHNNPSAYIMVGPKSRDPELREVWQLLPDETRADVRRIWGKDAMMVRKDSLDVMFGYRKLSLASILKKDPEAREGLEHFFGAAIENMLLLWARGKGMSQVDAENYAKSAAVRVTRAERVWQEIVRETKDLMVVKSGVVMLGNIWSNFTLLSLQGVPFKDMLLHHKVALKGATQYQQDSADLSRLQLQLDAGYLTGVDKAEAERQVARLQDSLDRNPVKELIDAGLMPTIVEDLAADDDIYSYKSAFVRKTEKYTSKLNPLVLDAAKTVYMAHDTKMYQGLSRITQLSDFVARYTLYQHLISKKDPMSKADAIMEASDAFVNYDIPMHRALQYTDDMGITMFTKYYMRIQRVLLKTAREHPARVMMEIALSRFMDLGPTVLEGSALKKLGNNPLNWGAFQFFGSLDELATVNGAMALLPTMK